MIDRVGHTPAAHRAERGAAMVEFVGVIFVAAVLIAAIGWRSRRWRLVWLPFAAVIGGIVAVGTYWFIESQGMSDSGNPAPRSLWVWLALTGAAVVAAYMLQGATWLVMKTEGPLQQWSRRIAQRCLWWVLAFVAAVSVWTPLASERIAERWFSWPNLLWFSPVPLLVLLSMWRLSKSLRDESSHAGPFVLTLLLVFLGYSGLGISLWPNIIPPDISIRAAAGPSQSLGFALVGALLIIPLILMYTAWGYWVFRGKVRRGDGYH